MQDELNSILGTQVKRGEVFRRAETRRVPLDAFRDAGIGSENDLSQA
jgi:hypothetical protein